VAFVDAAMGGAIVDCCRQLGYRNVVEINFGWKSPDHHYANMRSYMWSRMRDWLEHGAIHASPQLEIDLTGPYFHHNPHDQLVLESKEDMKQRGLDSPDSGDALALTFARPVDPVEDERQKQSRDPYDDEDRSYYGGAQMKPGPGAWMR